MLSDENKNLKDQAKAQAAPNQNVESLGYYSGMPYPGMELARCYVVIQRLGTVYPPDKALEAGTIFPELYRPYPY